MSHQRQLDYRDPAQFLLELNPEALRSGQRVVVRLVGGSDCIFTYFSTVDGHIHGFNEVTKTQISINAVDMVLTEN